MTMTVVWISSTDLDDFTSPFTPQSLFRLRRYNKHGRQCFIGYQSISNFFKNAPLWFVFQISSRCLVILMKHCLSCLIYYLKNTQTKVKLGSELHTCNQQNFLITFIEFSYHALDCFRSTFISIQTYIFVLACTIKLICCLTA